MDLDDKVMAKNALLHKTAIKHSPILMSMMFYNTRISQKLRLLVESAVQEVISKYFDDGDRLKEEFKVSEQHSAIKLDEDETGSVTVVGCSHIYENMMIDRVGLPLCNNDPVKTQWYKAPHYEQLFLSCKANANSMSSSINGGANGEEQLSLEPRVGKSCFNCDSVEHEISKCPHPKDFTRINSKKKEFLGTFNLSALNPNDLRHRYHDDAKIINPYHGCKPGKVSEELRCALNLKSKQLPLFVYRMRVYGYPPGYKIDHDHVPRIDIIGFSEAGEVSDSQSDSFQNEPNTRTPEVILYPGFNAPMPESFADEGAKLGFPPLNRRFKKKKKTPSTISSSTSHTSIPTGDGLDDDVIYVGSNIESIIDSNNSIKLRHIRSWYAEPLSTGMFTPKPTWRRPPMLESFGNYKEPEVTLDNLKTNQLVACDSSCLVFGDQSIPTERLKNIQTILNKMHSISNKSKKRRHLRKS